MFIPLHYHYICRTPHVEIRHFFTSIILVPFPIYVNRFAPPKGRKKEKKKIWLVSLCYKYVKCFFANYFKRKNAREQRRFRPERKRVFLHKKKQSALGRLQKLLVNYRTLT